MITGEHAVIRTAVQDDAVALKRLYDPTHPRSAFLDRKRELLVPTIDELRQLLTRAEAKTGVFYTVEDRGGTIRGFAVLRGSTPEISSAELVVMLLDDADYATGLADEVCGFLLHRAFVQMGLNKMMAQCLDWERAYRDFLGARGFESDGVQRDVLFAQGRWYDLESLTLFRRSYESMAEPGRR